jgi:hypothetical protein
MIDSAQKRGKLIKHLEDALALADEIEDGQTGFLIERALDEARSRQFGRSAEPLRVINRNKVNPSASRASPR